MGEIAYKICVFGESGVGKTTLARRYLTGYFEEDIKLTMGAELFVKYIKIDDIRIILQLWDFGGEDDFNFLLPLYSKGSSGGIFMFDLNNKASLNRIAKWIELFKEGSLKSEKICPILMVGGKQDLQGKIAITESEARTIAKENNLYKYIECSSKTGVNVDNLFEKLMRDILKLQNII
ncbi:MAG: GTP-binding protein [Candidatus Lokiarchaeota archaeon]|nr:GTP-binding protein [Candidatus Lokiarchaeota archaeon]